MPKRKSRAAAAVIEAPAPSGIGGMIMSHPREFVGILLGGTATVIIFVNALAMQTGPHPAPIFAARPAQPANIPPAPVMAAPQRQPVAPSQPQPVIAAPATQPLNRVQMVAEIQRELSRRGFYDGTADGIWGSKTDASARNFAQSAGVRVDANAPDELLRALQAPAQTAPAPQQASRRDPIADLIGSPPQTVPPQPVSSQNNSSQITAIQRALSDFGYGQMKATGTFDAATRSAIEKFERDRKMPVTGQVSERLMRELSTMTGRSID